jgi:hypothetical protein
MRSCGFVTQWRRQANVSEQIFYSIFRVGLIFDPEDEEDMFFRNFIQVLFELHGVINRTITFFSVTNVSEEFSASIVRVNEAITIELRPL